MYYLDTSYEEKKINKRKEINKFGIIFQKIPAFLSKFSKYSDKYAFLINKFRNRTKEGL